ncbi:YitT family protein [Erysipelothrix sp. HDW6C]|uniref:YitT family protein n=1 Tax=Erysipelothrix sp. HDW6C TaxID=2714930 RepID=UPI00140C3F92|nr:YitT family protein [Erysipelothrix sp. HDW6C]QIK70341.1 YitT family protein [Erysipelothrix sp. HDW6C]
MENLKLIKPKHILGVTIGALFSAAAIKIFVRPGDLVPAGVGGVTVLLMKEANRLFNITLSYGPLYLILNIILLAFVFNKLGKKFIALSFLHVFLTSLFVEIIPEVKVVSDPILLAVFGGIVNGIGSSFALRMNGSAGGTDFIAIYFSMVKNKPMWDKIMMFNVAVLLYSGWTYNWSLALYSIIYQMASTKIIETYHDRYKLSSLHVITAYPEEVSQAVFKVCRHGITQMDGIGVFKHKYKAMLYMVANEFEIKSIVNAIKETDAKAFIEISSVERIEGNYRQKPLD